MGWIIANLNEWHVFFFPTFVCLFSFRPMARLTVGVLSCARGAHAYTITRPDRIRANLCPKGALPPLHCPTFPQALTLSSPFSQELDQEDEGAGVYPRNEHTDERFPSTQPPHYNYTSASNYIDGAYDADEQEDAHRGTRRHLLHCNLM